MPATIGRNDPCPCGSGKKVKKCHPSIVGETLDWLYTRFLILKKYQGYLDFFRRQVEYMPPPDPATDWSHENFRLHGCPYVCENGQPACFYGTGDGICQSPGCGVGALESSPAGNMGDLIGLPIP